MLTNPLLQPIALAGLALRNRIVVAPMTRISATDAGVPTPRMALYTPTSRMADSASSSPKAPIRTRRTGRRMSSSLASSHARRSMVGGASPMLCIALAA